MQMPGVNTKELVAGTGITAYVWLTGAASGLGRRAREPHVTHHASSGRTKEPQSEELGPDFAETRETWPT